MALISIPTLLVSYNYTRIVKRFKDNLEYLFVGLYGIGFLLVFLTNKVIWGVGSFLSVYVAQEITKPYIASLVNKRTESKHRATAISTVSLFSEFPYMIITVFFGTLIEVVMIRYLYLGFVFMLGVYLMLRKTGKQLKSRNLELKSKENIEPIFDRD